MDDELLEQIETPQSYLPLKTAADAFTVLKTTDTSEVIQALQNREVLSVANNDETVKDKLNTNAKGIIETATDTIAKDTKLRNQHANFKVNEFACKIYGVDESCPIWQQRLMKVGAAFWFIIYWILASVTIVPVNTFLQMVGNIIKNNFCKCLLAILFYIVILGLVIGTPILVNFFKGA